MDNNAKSGHTVEAAAPTTKSTAASPSGRKLEWRKYFAGTGMYGFELLMATFGLTVAAIVVDYGLFAFFNYAKEATGGHAGSLFSEFSLWTVAAMLVWLPLSTVFYLRTRGQLAVTPERRQSTLHKVLVSIYHFVNILIVAGALFVVFHSLIRPLVNGADGEEFGNVLVRVTLPALLTIGVHGWALMAYGRSQRMTRKLFAIVFVGAGLLVMIGLLVASVSTIRGKAMDSKRERDLSVLATAIKAQYTDKRSLPKLLDDVRIDTSKLNLSLNEYSYVRQRINKYELCTKFATSTVGRSTRGDDEDPTYRNNYDSYPSFWSHDKGTYCFKIQAQAALCDGSDLTLMAGVKCARDTYDY